MPSFHAFLPVAHVCFLITALLANRRTPMLLTLLCSQDFHGAVSTSLDLEAECSLVCRAKEKGSRVGMLWGRFTSLFTWHESGTSLSSSGRCRQQEILWAVWLPSGGPQGAFCLRRQVRGVGHRWKDGKKLGLIHSLAALPLDLVFFEKINAFTS